MAPWDPLTTPRLTLREYTPTDASYLFTLESNAANARYQDWGPWTQEKANESVAQSLQQRNETPRSVVELAVFNKETGEFLGRVGARIQLDGGTEQTSSTHQAAAGLRHVDLWFSFLPEAQGRGFATEAVRGLVGALREREGEGLELEIECDPRNEGSWRLAERLGFLRFSLTERAWESKGEWVGSVVYRIVV